ncbi:hypothetical protein G7Y89_g10127 [Cudoniella acicularis]|uniref:DNA damage-binding protein CMR1 n=1 Tax=Cudoniella acicularis TaxID=354080 RepID=A0A8H4RH26_9HELO|nr:hypothetical protein G7Y89_g10127 [Cudoniella acicularis]
MTSRPRSTSQFTSRSKFTIRSNNRIFEIMAPVKKEKPAMSEFERKRLENIAANQAMLKDLSKTADKIMPKLPGRPKKPTAPKKRTAPIKKEEVRPTRTSSRLAGLEADSETSKRKAEVEYEFAKEQAKAKKMRVSGDLNFSDIVVDGKKFNKDDNFLSGIMRGAQPYERTFTEDDIKETTDEGLKALRERMSGLELYEGYEPNQIKITPERVYALGFHPSLDKPLIFAGDKMGNMGIFDASQVPPEVKAEDNGDDEEEPDTPEPAITALKLHSRTITSFVFPPDGNHLYSSSYDSSVRKFDLQKGVAVEVFAPESMDEDMPISSIAIPRTDPDILLFSTLDGRFGRHDMRSPKDTEIWELTDKKIGGFSIHPLQPHLVATASLDRMLKIWDLRNIKGKGDARAPSLLGEHESRLSVSHASWSAAGHVATSSYDDTIKIYSFLDAGSWKVGHELDDETMKPTSVIKHNNQTGRWVTILKPQWQERPEDGIQKFVIGNMNRFVDVFSADGEQLAQLGGDGITAVPAVAQFHPTKDWVAGAAHSVAPTVCLYDPYTPLIVDNGDQDHAKRRQAAHDGCNNSTWSASEPPRLTMAPEGDLKKRVVRKLTKRRKEGHQVTMDIPAKFQDGEDADEDFAHLHGGNAYMNQSVFGMIAAAGSQVDFNARFNEESSGEEDESTEPSSQSSELQVDKTRPGKTNDKPEKAEKQHRRKFSENRLLRSLPRLTSRSKSRASPKSPASPVPESPSESAAPAIQLSRIASKDAPVMSRMLEAKAELSMRPSFDIPRLSDDRLVTEDNGGQGPSILAKRLMQIFNFEKAEDVIEEYPCWLLKSVLLQGYMYITTKHICFYAYLPKKSNEVVKSGYLSKSGKRNPKFNRYWFRLKGDVLSYYSDPSDLYFPAGNIDLRYGISANIVDKEKGKDATHFTVITHQRKFNFKADSIPSAKEWVKALQKIIFRTHNEGDSVKISLPIENIIDIEDSQIVDFADTCKIRVIDNDETYAIDEYFFSFFSFGKEALNVLRILVEDTTAQQIPEDLLLPPPVNDGKNSPKSRESISKRTSLQLPREPRPTPPAPIRTDTPLLEESVRATLSPIRASGITQSPRGSTDLSRASSDAFRRSMDLSKFGRRSVDLSRLNMDGGRRSVSASRRSLSRNRLDEQKRQSEKQGSSDSYVHSLEDPGSSGALPSASDETQASASQILRGSDVFLSPTIQRSASATRRRDPDSILNHDPSSQSPTSHTQGNMPHSPQRQATTGSLTGSNAGQVEPSASAPTLQNLVKAGAYPLQRAAGFAGYLNKHSKRMSNLLATESMGYVEKVSGMWKGGKKHYDEPQGLAPDDELYEDGDDEQAAVSGDRFRDHFALPGTEKLQAAYFGYLHRVLPLYGKIYISDRSFCFRSLLPGTRTKLILPLKDVENVDKEKGFRFGYSGLVVVIKGHEELFFEFSQSDVRDDCAVTLLQNLETMRYLKESGLLTMEEKESAMCASAEHKALQQARNEGYGDHDVKMPKTAEEARADGPAILFDDPRASILNFKPTESLRITCLTIGSRGDVQPYIALCKGLIAEGHRPKIATHLEFKEWVEGHGIGFEPVAGDPAELMRICVEYGMFTYSFLREASSKFRGWIDGLLSTSWEACQNSDLLIESPSAMGGIHIAEALGIPYFRAFSMPWTRTRAYPHAFAVPDHKMGGAYNYITYVMFDNIFWKSIAGQVNRWRKKELGLQPTSLEKLQPNKVPFLYAFSPSVVIPPLDYSDWIRVTGYWFLDEGDKFEPPKELTDFIKKARDDGKKLVYIGFGSIVVSDSAGLTQTVVNSVLKADVRCILSKGWSDRLAQRPTNEVEVPLPPEIFLVKSVPHDWLFTQIDAACHHGGAGTTGASLRAGLPTIVKPFFGDQFFFGSRVEDLGVGIVIKKVNVSVLARALWEATNSQRMIVKAKVMGESIRNEHGVNTAIQSIYRDLEYAKSLIKNRDGKVPDDNLEDSEESWTFIGDESDPELIKRIHDWENMAQSSILSPKKSSGSEVSGSKSGLRFGVGELGNDTYTLQSMAFGAHLETGIAELMHLFLELYYDKTIYDAQHFANHYLNENSKANTRTQGRAFCCRKSCTPRDIYESFYQAQVEIARALEKTRATTVPLLLFTPFEHLLTRLAFADQKLLNPHEHNKCDIPKEAIKMGKSLSLGTQLKYPIIISKLLKSPGDPIKKQEAILQYKFTWMKQVGDPFGEQWDEEITTIADWDSPADGTIKQWQVKEGTTVEGNMKFVEIEEDCPHSVQFQGMCGMCGKDMTEMSWASPSDDTERAKINMIHDQTALKVSEDEALQAEKELQRRLLKQRKLSLVVDLDQTIIHACIEPTVGEWQNDPTSPNYEAVKDVRSFQLNDDALRGLASGCNYYIKMRPGLKEFLAKVSEMYELHVYTMGTRAYAINIAKIVDPDKKLFGDRIISRDENGNMTAKSLARLFPVDTKMVVIIDDRADVWPKNRLNLIKVLAYDFFLGIGDINSSFLPKREELPKIAEAPKRRLSKTKETGAEDFKNPAGEISTEVTPPESETKESDATAEGARISALEELVRMGGGDDQALREEQTAEQEKFLEKQLKERPLLHMQEKLDKEDEEVEDEAKEETKNGDTTHEHPHHRHNLLKDDDVELMYLEKHLSQVHKAFYDEYDSALVNAHGGRVAQLKPGHNKKVSIKGDAADLKMVPDIAVVMPRIKAKTLEGCVIVMSGLVPLGVDLMRSEIALQAISFGADLHTKVSKKVTHLVASTSRTRTTKVKQAARYPHIKIVNQQWLLNSMSKWEKEDEAPYEVHVSESDRKRVEGETSSPPSSIHDSDDSDDEESEDEENESIPNSQEEAADDDEGVMPSDFEEGHSPIEDLKSFDWGGADDELAEFMGEDGDSGNDSDTSIDSTASHESADRLGKKRKFIETDEENSDDESTLAKKQRVANSRTTGLKTVKTPSAELPPTPGPTGEEENGDFDFDEDDLEKDLMAELEKEEAEKAGAVANGDGGDGGG